MFDGNGVSRAVPVPFLFLSNCFGRKKKRLSLLSITKTVIFFCRYSFKYGAQIIKFRQMGDSKKHSVMKNCPTIENMNFASFKIKYPYQGVMRV